jgi:hypothetical protein
MLTTKNENDLKNHLYDKDSLIRNLLMKTYDYSKIIINCGHFLVVSDSTSITPVYTSILNFDIPAEKKNQIYSDFGDFSFGSFELGIDILVHFQGKSKDCKLTLLVNDWQKIEGDYERNESNPNKFRNQFFENFITPPRPYKELIDKNKLPDSIWLGYNNKDYFFFRETRLRDRFKRNIKKISMNQFFALNNQDCLISCSEFKKDMNSNIYYHFSDEYGISKLVENGKVGCAGEITQLIFEISDRLSEACLINILPYACRQSVNLGTKIAFDINSNIDLKVINIFPDSKSIKESYFLLHNYDPALQEI